MDKVDIIFTIRIQTEIKTEFDISTQLLLAMNESNDFVIITGKGKHTSKKTCPSNDYKFDWKSTAVRKRS